MKSVTTRYLMTCAAIGAAAGVLLIPVNFLAFAFTATAPMLVAVIVGFWLVGPVTALALVRRPGAALLTSGVSGVISMASPAGPSAIVTTLMVGAALELGFLITFYKVWKPWLFYATATAFQLYYLYTAFTFYEMETTSTWTQVLFCTLMMVSAWAAVWAGLRLAARLADTGVARGLAPRRTVANADTARADV
ncbi:ECF transporter S component [Paraoerskovia marina]|uniref:ECF transporter S component n=1 Tax=Paraoerskovia marina TaxID=545619 RepID=UPI000492C6AF|nr:ECF transporter S component [Paraoerskovia marina]